MVQMKFLFKVYGFVTHFCFNVCLPPNFPLIQNQKNKLISQTTTICFRRVALSFLWRLQTLLLPNYKSRYFTFQHFCFWFCFIVIIIIPCFLFTYLVCVFCFLILKHSEIEKDTYDGVYFSKVTGLKSAKTSAEMFFKSLF